MGALGWFISGIICFTVVMAGLLALVVWEEARAPQIRHPMSEDIPDDWC